MFPNTPTLYAKLSALVERCASGNYTNADLGLMADGAAFPKVERGKLTVVQLSASHVAVFGDTKTVKGTMRGMGGRFSSALADPTRPGDTYPGWRFPMSKRAALEEFAKERADRYAASATARAEAKAAKAAAPKAPPRRSSRNAGAAAAGDTAEV